jgi:hypothetical protein
VAPPIEFRSPDASSMHTILLVRRCILHDARLGERWPTSDLGNLQWQMTGPLLAGP